MRYMTTICTTLSLIVGGLSSTAHALELRAQVGLIPGYDELKLTNLNLNESGGSFQSSKTKLEDEDGTSIGFLLLSAPQNGFGLMQGLEVAYQTRGAKNYDVEQYGVGYRLGLGVVVAEGLRIDGGGRIMVGYVTTSDAIDSKDGITYGSGTIIPVQNDGQGVGVQYGLFVGLSYRFVSNFVVGAEVGYEFSHAWIWPDHVLNQVSGDGINAALSAGIAF